MLCSNTLMFIIPNQFYQFYLFKLRDFYVELNKYYKDPLSVFKAYTMGLLPDTQSYGLRMRRECHRGLAIPTCIVARASRTCRDACRDRWPAVSFEVSVGQNVPGIPGACATHNFSFLVRGPWENWNAISG